MYSTALRQDTPPVPSLPNYAFGERLGAGSYGPYDTDWKISLRRSLTLGTVYKARLISVRWSAFLTEQSRSRGNRLITQETVSTHDFHLKSIPSRPSSAMNVRPTSAAPTFYAIKCINRKLLNKATEDLLINEIKLLKTIKHDHIVEMYDFQVILS